MKKVLVSVVFTLICGFALAEDPVLIPQTRHFAPITSIAMHPTNTFVFSADKMGNIKQWNVSSKRLLRNIKSSLSNIESIKVLGGVGSYSIFVYSKTENKIEIISLDSNKTIKILPFAERLLYLDENYYKAAKEFQRSGHIIQLIGSEYRYWLDYKTFEVLKKIKLGFVPPENDLYTFSSYAQTMFYTEEGKIKKRIFTELEDYDGGVLTGLSSTDSLRNIQYADGGYSKNYLLLATKEAFHVFNLDAGTRKTLFRKCTRVNAPFLIERARNMDQEYYSIKYNQLGYSKMKKMFVLGEAVVPEADVTKVLTRYAGVIEMENIKAAYTNYSNQNLIIGFKDSDLLFDFTEEPQMSAIGVAAVYGATLQVPKELNNIEENSLLLVDRHLKKYNLNKAQLEKEWFDAVPNLKNVKLSKDKKLAVLVYDKQDWDASFYNLEKEEYYNGIRLNKKEELQDIHITTSNSAAILSSKEGTKYFVKLYDLEKSKITKSYELQEEVLDLNINETESLVAVTTRSGVTILQAYTLGKVGFYAVESSKGAFFTTEDQMVLYTEKGWFTFSSKKGPNLKTEKPIGASNIINRMCYKQNTILQYFTGSQYGLHLIRNNHTTTFTNPVAAYIDVLQDAANNRIVVALGNGEIQFMDSKTQEVRVSLVSKDSRSQIPMPNYLFYASNNTYFGSRNAFEVASFSFGNKLFPLSHFDVQYNKPSWIVKELYSKDKEYSSLLQAVQEKRTAREGYETQTISNLPSIFSLNDSTISVTEKDSALFFIQVNGEGESISMVQAFVNGVPVLEVDSFALKEYFKLVPNFSDLGSSTASSILDMAAIFKSFGSKDTNQLKNTLHRFRFSWPIALAYGENNIEFFCTNSKGLRSQVLAYSINKKNPKQKKPNLYVFALSISNYKDQAYNLKYARKDGRDVLNHFKNNKVVLQEHTKSIPSYRYNQIYLDSFFDENATKAALTKMTAVLQKTTVNDVVVLYISGHGVLDNDLDFWYATYDMDFKDPQKNGISYKSLENVLKYIPARNRLLIMDACHSGEVDKESQEGLATITTTDLNVNYKGTYIEDQEPKIGLQNSFELMKELFTDVSRESGIQVVSAAAGNSYALESDLWKNGIFTYCILQALSPYEQEAQAYSPIKQGSKYSHADRNKDHTISVAELQEYVRKLVEQKTNGAQKPTSRQGSIEFDFPLW